MSIELAILGIVILTLIVDRLFIGRIFLTYVLSEKAVVLKYFFLLPLARFDYSKIVEIRRTSAVEATSRGNMSLYISRIFATSLLLKYGPNWTDSVVITPDHPDAFIAEVKRRVKEKTGRDI